MRYYSKEDGQKIQKIKSFHDNMFPILNKSSEEKILMDIMIDNLF